MNSEFDKGAIYLALGTDNAHDRSLPMQGTCGEVKKPADLVAELAELDAPRNAVRGEVFEAFAIGRTEARPQ